MVLILGTLGSKLINKTKIPKAMPPIHKNVTRQPTNSPKMYLVKGDIVNLLKQDHDFHYVEYINSKNKATKKWLHCSALEACNKY